VCVRPGRDDGGVSDDNEFEPHVVDFSGMPGTAEYRAKLDRDRTEARRRYVDYLAAVIVGTDDTVDPTERANAILDALTVWRRTGSDEPCRCSCHPHLPTSDHHDFGFACTCLQTPEERKRGWDDWKARMDESGSFSNVWVSGDLDDESSFELRECEQGDVIAEGTTGAAGYGSTPVERIQFIADAVRTHLGRVACDVHTSMREDLGFRFGRAVKWCPECGVRL